ncbi:MAG: hypothetical protein PHY93_07605, partial [Bacteriovorax sp.]|nr:hypothetical protein [Bacteriovorax sp.]
MQIRTLLQQLKLLPPVRFLIFLGLLFIGPSITAQTDPTVPVETKNQIQNQVQNQIQNQIQEEHDTKNLDKLLIDYNKDSEKVLKDASKIIQKDEASELKKSELDVGQDNSPDEEVLVKKADLSIFDLRKKKIDPKNLKKIKYSEALKVTLGPLQKMSERELVQLLRDNTKGSSA